jgi:hypothetical protein
MDLEAALALCYMRKKARWTPDREQMGLSDVFWPSKEQLECRLHRATRQIEERIAGAGIVLNVRNWKTGRSLIHRDKFQGLIASADSIANAHSN